jgi:hypothetical protein
MELFLTSLNNSTIFPSAAVSARFLFRSVSLRCLQPQSSRIGDAVHAGSDGTEYATLPRRHVISARPCSTISEYASILVAM